MKELLTILKQAHRISSENSRAVLATVVDVRGSSYRLPGAKMLIAETGEIFGTISGGCLEADVLERAQRVLATNEPEILRYDTTTNDDSVFSLNMGCRSVIRILLETTSGNDYFEFIRNRFAQRQTAIVTRVIQTNDKTNLPIGARFFVTNQAAKNDFASDFEREVSAAALRLLENNRSQSQTHKTDAAETFLEIVKPPIELIVFGAAAPETIALSILAEIEMVFARRAGGFFARTARLDL